VLPKVEILLNEYVLQTLMIRVHLALGSDDIMTPLSLAHALRLPVLSLEWGSSTHISVIDKMCRQSHVLLA
jgi:hypothetical protein